MAFIRRKVVGGRVYKYEVENVRDAGGGVHQRVIRYLGPESPVYGTASLRRGAKAKSKDATKR